MVGSGVGEGVGSSVSMISIGTVGAGVSTMLTELPAETPGEGAGVTMLEIDVTVGAVVAQSAGLEPFDLPDFPHDVALDPAALAALAQVTEGAAGSERPQSPGSQETDDREKEDACG